VIAVFLVTEHLQPSYKLSTTDVSTHLHLRLDRCAASAGLGSSGIAGEELHSWSDALSLLQELIGHAANTFVNVFLGKGEPKWFVYNYTALL